MLHVAVRTCSASSTHLVVWKCWIGSITDVEIIEKRKEIAEKKEEVQTLKKYGEMLVTARNIYLLWEATSQGSQQSWRFFCLYGVLFGVTICWLLDKGIYTEHLLIVGQRHLRWTFVDCWTRAFTVNICWLLDKGIYNAINCVLIVGQRHLHWTFVDCWTKALTQDICWLLDKGICTEHLFTGGQRHLHWTFVDCWTRAFTVNICWLLDKGIYAEHLLIVGQRHLRWAFVDCWTKAFTLNICPLLYPLPLSSILCEPVVCWDLEFSQAAIALTAVSFIAAFDQRWCVLEHGALTYYLNDKVSLP